MSGEAVREPNFEPRRPHFLAAYGEWVWRGGSMIISMMVLYAVLWLRGEFVGKTEYGTDRRVDQEISRKVSDTMIRMEDKLRIDQDQNDALKDHEGRIRTLERKP